VGEKRGNQVNPRVLKTFAGWMAANLIYQPHPSLSHRPVKKNKAKLTTIKSSAVKKKNGRP